MRVPMRHAAVSPIAFLMVLGGLAGCATESVEVRELPGTADPTVELSRLQEGIRAGEEKELQLLSPTFFQESKKALREANEMKADGEPNAEVLHEISRGQSYLSKADSVGRLSRLALGPVLVARADAMDAGAMKIFPEEFAENDRDLRNAAMKVEEGDTGGAQAKRDQLAGYYRKLEKDGLKVVQLDPAKRDLERAKKLGAEKYAPKTLAKAEKSIQSAEKTIDKDPKNRELIEDQAEDARKNADFLVRVTRETKRHGDPSAEMAVVQSLEQQEQIASLREESQEQAAELGKTEEELSQLQGRQQKFAKLRSLFKPDEAEVLRNDGEVVIRLKGLSFETGKSDIASQNFDLLGRASRAIQELGADEVVVEGHTDATGSRKVNQRLSTERAESVKDFFVANEVLPEDKIEAEGKGFSEPIASNKDAQGRALNRRVDIRIETVG